MAEQSVEHKLALGIVRLLLTQIPSGSNFIVQGVFYLPVSCEKGMPEGSRARSCSPRFRKS